MDRVEQRAAELREQERIQIEATKAERAKRQLEEEERLIWYSNSIRMFLKDLTDALSEATSGRAEIAEPLGEFDEHADVALMPYLGIWYRREMFGRVVRKHVLNVESDRMTRASDGYGLYAVVPSAEFDSRREDDLDHLTTVDRVVDLTVEAMAKSLAAGCTLLPPG